MGLGRTLVGIREEKEGKVSILPQLDKAILEKSGKFSFRSIKFFLNKLIDNVDKKDKQAMLITFLQLYKEIAAPEYRESGVFHPSGLYDACPRCSYYELNGYEVSDPLSGKPDARLQRIFDMGSWIHLYVQVKLLIAGVLEEMEVDVISDELFVKGKADGVVNLKGEKYVLEIKSINSYQFAKLKFGPLNKHRGQASLYAHILGIEKIIYLYVNKDSLEIKEFIEPIEKKDLKIMLSFIESVKTAKEVPERTCVNKFTDQALRCSYCSICFK